MSPQKIKGHFDRQKLMLLIRLTRGGQRLITSSVKPDRQRSERGLALVQGDASVAFAVEADFNAAGMKAFSPIEFFTHREVMPLETEPRVAHAAVQMMPALPDRVPDRAFGKLWGRFQTGIFVDVN